jgi:hypothetical protein
MAGTPNQPIDRRFGLLLGHIRSAFGDDQSGIA